MLPNNGANQGAGSTGDIDRLREVVNLLTEMLWLTNNLIAHSSQEAFNRIGGAEDRDHQKLAVMEGLDQTYIKLIRTYTALEAKV